MKRITTLAGVILAVAFSTSAFAVREAAINVLINGLPAVQSQFQFDGDSFSFTSSPSPFQGDGWSAQIDNFSGVTDPFLSFALGASNFTSSPITFTFGFTMPISISGSILATSALSGSVSALPDHNGGSASLGPGLDGNTLLLQALDTDASGIQRTKGVDLADFVPPCTNLVVSCGPLTAS